MTMVRWCVSALLLGHYICSALNTRDYNDIDNATPPAADNDDYLLKQVVWKRCYRKLTPACLKLNLVRTVELMSKDSSFFLLPGVFFSSNTTDSSSLPPDISRSLSSEHAPLDDLVAFTLGKYLRSLTLNVNLVDFISGGNETLQNSVIDAFSGRKKDGFGGYGAVAAMMGGMMASMMMAALAALAGKALMTSLLALMMAAFSAMKGGGGGDHESKTYEVITKPIVSHINTHSSEVQHEHGHYHKRSLDQTGGESQYVRMVEENTNIGKSGEENNEDTSYSKVAGEEGFFRHKRSVDSLDPPDSKIYHIFQSPEHADDNRSHLREHIRQNHRKYKRFAEDDLIMAFGLLR